MTLDDYKAAYDAAIQKVMEKNDHFEEFVCDHCHTEKDIRENIYQGEWNKPMVCHSGFRRYHHPDYVMTFDLKDRTCPYDRALWVAVNRFVTARDKGLDYAEHWPLSPPAK